MLGLEQRDAIGEGRVSAMGLTQLVWHWRNGRIDGGKGFSFFGLVGVPVLF